MRYGGFSNGIEMQVIDYKCCLTIVFSFKSDIHGYSGKKLNEMQLIYGGL